MSEAVWDWHLDWILGLLVALTVLGVVTAALLGSILGEVRKFRQDYWRDRGPFEGSNRIP